MKQNEETVDPIFKKGFEHGYWLAKGNKPELHKAVKELPQGKYLSGLKAGQKEVEREKVREEFKQMDINREKNKEKGVDKEL